MSQLSLQQLAHLTRHDPCNNKQLEKNTPKWIDGKQILCHKLHIDKVGPFTVHLMAFCVPKSMYLFLRSCSPVISILITFFEYYILQSFLNIILPRQTLHVRLEDAYVSPKEQGNSRTFIHSLLLPMCALKGL